MARKDLFFGRPARALAMVFGLALGGCTTTDYLGIVTPHDAAEVASDNVQVFEGKSYDQAVALAGEAGFEVILSYEGRTSHPLGFLVPKVRVLAKDGDGIRPGSAPAPSAAAPADSGAAPGDTVE
jgi:hypothetical protein